VRHRGAARVSFLQRYVHVVRRLRRAIVCLPGRPLLVPAPHVHAMIAPKRGAHFVVVASVIACALAAIAACHESPPPPPEARREVATATPPPAAPVEIDAGHIDPLVDSGLPDVGLARLARPPKPRVSYDEGAGRLQQRSDDLERQVLAATGQGADGGAGKQAPR
jgi:hypothetical protein